MKNYNELIKKARALKLEKKLLTENDIRNIVDNFPTGKINIFKTLKWRIIMTSSIIAILAGLFLLINNTDPGSKQAVSSSMEKKEKAASEKGNSASSSKVTNTLNNKELALAIRVDDDKKTIKTVFKQSNSPSKQASAVPDILPWNLKGIKVLELTDAEFEKLVPNSRVNDTTFIVFEEYYINNEAAFNRRKMKDKGFNLNDLPMCNLTHGVISPSIWKFKIEPGVFYKASEHLRTIYIAYSTTSVSWNPDRGMLQSTKPYLLDNSNNPILTEYVKFNRLYPELAYKANKSNDPNERNRIEIEYKKHQNALFSQLIPVRIQILPKQSMIFWFYPNEEFLSALPERYSSSLRKELELKSKLERGEIEPSDACKGLQSAESVFGICNLSDGAIKFENLYPNPESSLSKLQFSLLEERNLEINIFNMEAGLVQSIIKEKHFNIGTHTIELTLDKLPPGVYFVVLSTNKNERIVKRIVKM